MLAIRLQRTGRKGYPMYRIAVQEAKRHPSSGRVVAYVGSYNPHTKETILTTDRVEFYLKNGAQPTPRVVKILSEQNVKLPDWVVKHGGDKKAAIKKADKLRKNQPKEEALAAEKASTDEASSAATETEASGEEAAEA